jgi:hypothetical protein
MSDVLYAAARKMRASKVQTELRLHSLRDVAASLACRFDGTFLRAYTDGTLLAVVDDAYLAAHVLDVSPSAPRSGGGQGYLGRVVTTGGALTAHLRAQSGTAASGTARLLRSLRQHPSPRSVADMLIIHYMGVGFGASAASRREAAHAAGTGDAEAWRVVRATPGATLRPRVEFNTVDAVDTILCEAIGAEAFAASVDVVTEGAGDAGRHVQRPQRPGPDALERVPPGERVSAASAHHAGNVPRGDGERISVGVGQRKQRENILNGQVSRCEHERG